MDNQPLWIASYVAGRNPVRDLGNCSHVILGVYDDVNLAKRDIESWLQHTFEWDDHEEGFCIPRVSWPLIFQRPGRWIEECIDVSLMRYELNLDIDARNDAYLARWNVVRLSRQQASKQEGEG